MAKREKPQLQLQSWFLPALVGLVLVLHLLIPYRGWRILLVGFGGAWLVSYLWARSLARGLRFTREMRFGWAQVGDKIIERFTLANDGRAPALWVEIVDQSTIPDYQASRGISIDGQHWIRWHRQAVCTRRGLFILGPTTVQTSDPFGLYTVTLDYPASFPLMVLPPIVPLPTIEVAPGGRVGEGRPRPYAIERSVSAAGVREYRPNDSLRQIHWRTSARRDSLFVRLLDGTPASDWWVLLDMDQDVQVGEGQDATEEHAVILAASLADRGLRLGKAVGLAAHGEQLVWLPPREGEGQRWEVLRSLALVSLGSRPLAQLLAGMQSTLDQCTSLVIITPTVDTDWVEALVPLLRRGVTPTVLLLDPLSFARPQPSDLAQDRPSDPSTGPFGSAQDRPLDPAQDRPLDPAQDRPFDPAQDRPFDPAQGRQRDEAGDSSLESAPSRACRVVAGLLVDLGVAHYVITRDLLDQSQVRSDQRGHWGRPVPGTAPVPTRQPRRAGWKVLSR